MEFHLTEEQRMIKDTVRHFVDRELNPQLVQANDSNEEFSLDILKKLARQDLLGAPIPEKYGGLGHPQISSGYVEYSRGLLRKLGAFRKV